MPMTVKEELESIKSDIAQVSKISAEMAKEKYSKRLKLYKFFAVVLAVLLFLSNAVWIMYVSQFEKVVETTETVTFEGVEQFADGGGSNNIVGGDYVNGAAEN